MKPFAVGLCLLASCVTGAPAKDPPSSRPAKSALAGDGPLQKVRGPLERILQFTFSGGDLKVDRAAWGKVERDKGNAAPNPFGVPRFDQGPPVEAVFREIQTTAGPGGSGMSISGNEREVSFFGNVLSGRLHTRGDSVRLVLEESQGSGRTLEYSDDGKGAFRIQLSHPDGDLILLQQRRGGFAAVALVGGRTFAGQGESFLAVFKQHRQTMDADVLPALAQVGIQPILSPQAPKVRQAVLALAARKPEVVAEGGRLITELDSDSFAARDKATQLLNDRYALYKDLITEKLKHRDTPLEVRSRLQRIVDRHRDQARVDQTVVALDLLHDARYLVSLLDQATPEEMPGLVSQLEKTTGRKDGADTAAWKEWARKNLK